ncbi:histone-lysine N-methyltransferase SETMAR [Trichonephila clavipes]|nr:histone-lysine N-methyltransferase SETMAR [Trichonephila clavipes]
MEVNKEKIRFFLEFFFDKGENTRQVAEIANDVYGGDTVTGSSSIAQELKIDHKIVLSHLRKAGFKKKLHVWVPHQLH